MTSLNPSPVSKETCCILVKPNLQVRTDKDYSTGIFALGDVAEHGGPKMARAGYIQADVVLNNILSMIGNRDPTKVYTPNMNFEGAIKLTLGKTRWVMYSMESDGNDMLLSGEDGKLELEVEKAWSMFGADYRTADALAGREEGGKEK